MKPENLEFEALSHPPSRADGDPLYAREDGYGALWLFTESGKDVFLTPLDSRRLARELNKWAARRAAKEYLEKANDEIS